MVLPDQPAKPAGEDWDRWRGSVDTTLIHVDRRMTTVEKEVKETNRTLSTMPADIATAIKNGEAAPAPGNGQGVTFKWLTEKFLLPVVLLVASLIIAAAFSGG